MEESQTIRMTLSRFDPERDAARRMETHLVPYTQGMTILDAIFYVYENIDRSLAFSYGCRYGRCGLCAVNVNGRPTLICQTPALQEMVVEPLANYPVVRDLVIERGGFGERTRPYQPFLEREARFLGKVPGGMQPEILKPKEFEIFKTATRCVDCYSCNSICPIVSEEKSTDRGPNLMMQMAPYLFDPRDRLDRTGFMQELAALCLLCGTCAENCPKDLSIDEIMAEARAKVVEKRGLPFTKRFALNALLWSRGLLSFLLKGSSLVRGLLFKRVPGESGLHLRFPLGKIDSRRVLPELAEEFFLDQSPHEVIAVKESDRVAFFVGCSMNYLFPQLGQSTLRVLNRFGVSVISPEGQKCCGLPAYGSGDLALARKLALANIEAFEKVHSGKIVVACGSCGAHLKKHYPKLFQNETAALRERVERFSESIIDLTVYLAGRISEAAPSTWMKEKLPGRRVTYHDSCHSKRKLQIQEEPRALLRTAGVELVEMAAPDQCCGLGGSFGLENYELSAKILDHKMEDVEKTGAEIVATGCMGCLIQLQQGIYNRAQKIKAKHIVEVLDEMSA
ncbi:MAG: 4Fe-4S dicluster domain-containing protein [Deltaproteobacteria bacterium]|nr:4Fe-4S dicluster domain-containing protein [Deltaproteobacteria bacterium]